jgi:hypothetical protein
VTGCIDGLGGAYVHRLNLSSDIGSDNKRVRTDPSSLEIDPLHGLPQARASEYGWAGASFDKEGNKLAVCHGYGRWVGLCDITSGGTVNLGYLSRPVRGLDWFNENTVAFAESETVALWDVRSEAKRSTFSRCTPSSSGTLHCITALNDDHLIACAGSDRVVYIIDNRTMRVLRHWRSPCKFDITSIHPSMASSNVIYLSGLDNEIMTCDILPNKQKHDKQKRRPKLGTTNNNNNNNAVEDNAAVEDEKAQGVEEEVVGGHGRLHQSHSLGIRGDARWIGVTLCGDADEEVILGVCASGTINVLRNPNRAKHARG